MVEINLVLIRFSTKCQYYTIVYYYNTYLVGIIITILLNILDWTNLLRKKYRNTTFTVYKTLYKIILFIEVLLYLYNRKVKVPLQNILQY